MAWGTKTWDQDPSSVVAVDMCMQAQKTEAQARPRADASEGSVTTAADVYTSPSHRFYYSVPNGRLSAPAVSLSVVQNRNYPGPRLYLCVCCGIQMLTQKKKKKKGVYYCSQPLAPTVSGSVLSPLAPQIKRDREQNCMLYGICRIEGPFGSCQ